MQSSINGSAVEAAEVTQLNERRVHTFTLRCQPAMAEAVKDEALVQSQLVGRVVSINELLLRYVHEGLARGRANREASELGKLSTAVPIGVTAAG